MQSACLNVNCEYYTTGGTIFIERAFLAYILPLATLLFETNGFFFLHLAIQPTCPATQNRRMFPKRLLWINCESSCDLQTKSALTLNLQHFLCIHQRYVVTLSRAGWNCPFFLCLFFLCMASSTLNADSLFFVGCYQWWWSTRWFNVVLCGFVVTGPGGADAICNRNQYSCKGKNMSPSLYLCKQAPVLFLYLTCFDLTFLLIFKRIPLCFNAHALILFPHAHLYGWIHVRSALIALLSLKATLGNWCLKWKVKKSFCTEGK